MLTVRKHGSVFNFKQVYDMLRSMINWRMDRGREPQVREITYQTFENTEIIGALSVGMKRTRTM